MKRLAMWVMIAAGIALDGSGAARGQPADPPPPGSAEPPGAPAGDPAGTPAGEPAAPAEPTATGEPVPTDGVPPDGAAEAPAPVAPPEPVITVHPELFRAPSGRLLPAGHIYGRGGLDTGGGASAGLRLGLGDVAEFGVDVTDLVRARDQGEEEAGRLFPYLSASFKMGIGEHVLFRNQPALALGFRKSFERDIDGHRTRFAELYLTASKSLGSRADVHAGVSMWDAVLETGDQSTFLHDGAGRDQIRAFGGLEIEPLPDSSILLEISWTPEFIYGATAAEDAIELTPMFTWGVRYSLGDWGAIESGVRIPDIRDADLLGAQIFGQVKFISRALARVMKRPK